MDSLVNRPDHSGLCSNYVDKFGEIYLRKYFSIKYSLDWKKNRKEKTDRKKSFSPHPK